MEKAGHVAQMAGIILNQMASGIKQSTLAPVPSTGKKPQKWYFKGKVGFSPPEHTGQLVTGGLKPTLQNTKPLPELTVDEGTLDRSPI